MLFVIKGLGVFSEPGIIFGLSLGSHNDVKSLKDIYKGLNKLLLGNVYMPV